MSVQPLVVSRTDPYQNPELFRWTGSMEGVPDWVEPEQAGSPPLLPDAWSRGASSLLESAAELMPGLAIAAALAWLGEVIAPALATWVFGTPQSPVSPILIAILAGLAIRNGVGLPRLYDAGLVFSVRRILRIGVALLGFRLSLSVLASVGVTAVPIVIGCIASALLAVRWLCGALDVPRRMAALIAVGTAICGNTAIVAAGPVIGAQRGEMSYAVGAITLFGLLALIGYPFLAHLLFGGDARLAGLFLGTAIHDTAQVAGAGLLYLQQYQDGTALEVATVTKLVRNVFMLAVIPLIAVAFRAGEGEDGAGRARPSIAQVVPWFVVGFVAMALLRTLGDLGAGSLGGVLPPQAWDGTIAAVSSVSAWCLAIAMASVGLGTDVGRLRALGWRPLGAGLCVALAVGGASVVLIHGLRWMGIV